MNSVLYLFSTITWLPPPHFYYLPLYCCMRQEKVWVIFKPPFKSEYVLIQTNVNFMQTNVKSGNKEEFVHFCLSTTFYFLTIEIPLLPLGFGPSVVAVATSKLVSRMSNDMTWWKWKVPTKNLLQQHFFYNITLLSSAPDINLPLPGFPGPETVHVHIVKSPERTESEREREREYWEEGNNSLFTTLSLLSSPLITLIISGL